VLCIAAGCKKDDAVINKVILTKPVQSAIAGVNGPTTGNINEELTFNIVWHVADSTLVFDHLNDSTFQNTRMIKLFVSSQSTDTTSLDKETNTIRYKFKATTAGTYYLKFFKPDNLDKSAIIDTIHILDTLKKIK